jgi:hypothetical protein
VHKNKIKLVFLSETRQCKEVVEGLRWRLGLKHVISFKEDGKGGGVALFWDESIEVDLLGVGSRCIDVCIKNMPIEIKWRCTFVYGEPCASQRKNMWDLLRRIKPNATGPWLMAGDFNEALWQGEHFSKSRRNEKQMLEFREVLSHCDLHDLGFVGLPWTFDNKQKGDRNVRVRLDRAVACPEWMHYFKDYRVEHLVSPRSDHSPLLISFSDTPADKYHKPCRRYEAFWERENSLGEEIEGAWNGQRPAQNMQDIGKKLDGLMDTLQTWSKRTIGSVPRKLEKLRKRLQVISKYHDEYSVEEKRRISLEMNELLAKEEVMWKQRSRVDWLNSGDQNTSYFHRKASWRSKKNNITQLSDGDGNIMKNEEKIKEMTTEFFKDLYSTDESVDPEGILHLFQEKINAETNEKLCQDFTDDEISNALFQIGPMKSPGPDGFPARFFQRNWGLVKEEVISAVKEFFRTGSLPEGTNDTSIVLIPKSKDAVSLKDYRPISLCNVIYKIISKCMANRLRPVLDEIISPSQSAFIPGRMITDNALMAFECIYALQTNNNKAGEFCAYKLDLSKAYDRVDWTFLERSMRRLGFADKWIDWIMACVTSVRYAVRLNGSLLEAFHPTRGLRQGDPLSPYLFLLVAEGLSVLIDHEIRESRMKELKICRRAPGLSHLLFADDSLLFFEAKKEQAEIVKKILGKYERGTGQLLSPSKCSILLGNKVKEEDGQQTLSILNIEKAEFEEKYLGLPVPEGRMKNGQFEPTKDCIRKYMNDWCEKYMSSGAKETLIKSVVQAVSTYAMSIFKFSAGLCDEFSQITRNFWWGDELDRKKIHWKAWEKSLPLSILADWVSEITDF